MRKIITSLLFVPVLLLLPVLCPVKTGFGQVPEKLQGGRFLTLNSFIRVDWIEFSRDKNTGRSERHLHSPEAVTAFRQAVADVFPEGRITWALSWLAIHDETENYRKIRELLVSYHKKYGDDITFVPGGYFANAYNTREQVSKDIHDALAEISRFVGGGYRPKSVIAGFLAADNLQFLAEKENIHVCQGTIWSQFSIDNQDGDGSVCYPYYPSKEHFCKPAQGKEDFIDCVNLDGWTCDFLSARRPGFRDGFNSRMGVGPIETFGNKTFSEETALKEMLHTMSVHFDRGVELNGFGWVTNCWELSLTANKRMNADALKTWLSAVKKRWADTQLVTAGEFGLLWRTQHKENDFDYRFEECGSGIGGSDKDKEIRWYMNRDFRLALLRNFEKEDPFEVIDLTRYGVRAAEPKELTRKWSLLGEINQKQTRPQDKPVPFQDISEESREIIRKRYPDLK